MGLLLDFRWLCLPCQERRKLECSARVLRLPGSIRALLPLKAHSTAYFITSPKLVICHFSEQPVPTLVTGPSSLLTTLPFDLKLC